MDNRKFRTGAPAWFLATCVAVLLSGCAGLPPVLLTATPPAGAEFTHVLIVDADYYLDGPQQDRPPDGAVRAGTRARLLRDAGSYLLVEVEGGLRAYIAADTLKSIE